MLSAHRTTVPYLWWAILLQYRTLLVVWAGLRQERSQSPNIPTCLSWSAAPRRGWFDLISGRPIAHSRGATKNVLEWSWGGAAGAARVPHGSDAERDLLDARLPQLPPSGCLAAYAACDD